jgi:hypothetical protein
MSIGFKPDVKSILMKRIFPALLVLATISVGMAVAVLGAQLSSDPTDASPIYGVTLPVGYRNWELVAPALEGEPLDELRAVVGNAVAIEAYRAGTLPFPAGTVLVKLAWKRVQSPEFEPASVPGAATTVQVMVKDPTRYATTGGWGFGRFINGKPVDEAQHETCFACHEAQVRGHDYVFTRYAR